MTDFGYHGPRITPEQVEAAYQSTGLKPAHGNWFSKGGECACGVGVVAAATGKAQRTRDGRLTLPRLTFEAAKCLDLPWDYLGGFVIGFEASFGSHIPDNPMKVAAVADGLTASARVFGYPAAVPLSYDERRVLRSFLAWDKYVTPHGNHLRRPGCDKQTVRNLVSRGFARKLSVEHWGPDDYALTPAGAWVATHEHPHAGRLFPDGLSRPDPSVCGLQVELARAAVSEWDGVDDSDLIGLLSRHFGRDLSAAIAKAETR